MVTSEYARAYTAEITRNAQRTHAHPAAGGIGRLIRRFTR